MTAKRAAAIAGIIFAATLTTSLFGAAMAAEKEQGQTQTQPPASIVQSDESSSASTAANIHALTVYLQWKKCKDNILPQCP